MVGHFFKPRKTKHVSNQNKGFYPVLEPRCLLMLHCALSDTFSMATCKYYVFVV